MCTHTASRSEDATCTENLFLITYKEREIPPLIMVRWIKKFQDTGPVRLAYQPPASSTFFEAAIPLGMLPSFRFEI
jgi:hypothetical protein